MHKLAVLEMQGAEGGQVPERVVLDHGDGVGAEVEELQLAQMPEAVLVHAREVVGREYEGFQVRELVECARLDDAQVGALFYRDLVERFLVDERGQRVRAQVVCETIIF